MKRRPATKETYVQSEISPTAADEFLVDHLRYMNLRCRAEAHTEAVDKEYTDSRTFWNNVINENLRALRWVRLVNFQVSSWYPRSPGLFHTESAAHNRKEAEAYITERDGVRFFQPYGKGTMIQGGLGSVRFQTTRIDGDDCWFGTAVDEGLCHSGIPLVIPENLAREIRFDSGDRFCIVGQLRFLPPFLRKTFGHLTSIPQLYVRVDKLERVSETSDNLLITPMVFFVTSKAESGGSPANVTYVTCSAGDSREMEKAVKWLKWYAHAYGGEIVTDFDQQCPMFPNVPFSLQNVMTGRVEIAKIRSLISDPALGGAATEAAHVTINLIAGDLVEGDKAARDKIELHQDVTKKSGVERWKKAVEILAKPVPLLIINVIGALLFFPFQSATSLPGAMAVLASLVLGWVAWRRRKLAYLISAFLIGIIGLSWAAVGVFVVSKIPLYCYSMRQPASPLAGKLIPIGKNEAVARLFYIADPVRQLPALQKVIRQFNRNVFFLNAPTQSESDVILMPLKASVRRTVIGTGSVNSADELLLSYYGPALSVDVDLESKKSVSVGVGLLYHPIIDYTHKAMDRNEAPWEWVSFTPGSDMNAALYVANSDAGLTAAAKGDFAAAIESLESAYQFAPSGLERARNRALLGLISVAVINGNIGQTQSLSYFSKAMQDWPAAQQGKPLGYNDLKSSPVDKWLYNVLTGVFFSRRHEFQRWASILFENVPLHVKEDPGSLISTERHRLLSLIGQDGDTTALERDLRERDHFSEEALRWTAETFVYEAQSSAYNDKGFFPYWDTRLFAATDWIINQLPEPWHNQYARCFRSYKTILAASNRLAQTGDTGPFAEANRRFAEEWKFASIASVEDQMLLSLKLSQEPNFEFQNIVNGSREPWWDRRFLDWFGASVFALSPSLGDTCKRPGEACRRLLNAVAVRFARDRSGQGPLFAPGIAYVLWASGTFNQHIDGDWTTIYLEAVGGDPTMIGKDIAIVRRSSPPK